MPLPCCQVRGWGYHLECLEFESEECVLWMVFVVEWDAEESVWGFFDGEREVERLLQLVRRFFLTTGGDPELLESLSLESLELEEAELELSELNPEGCCGSTVSAMAAMSGRKAFRTLYHFLDNFGLPRRVLCQTT